MTHWTATLERPRARGLLAGLFVGALVLVLAAGLGALAADEALLSLLLPVAALVGLLVAARPELATYLVIGLIYSNAAVVAVKFHGLPFIVGASVPILLVAPIAHILIVRRQPLVIAPALPLVLAYAVFQILSTLFASDVDAPLAELETFALEGIGLFFLVTNVVRTPEALRGVVWTLVGVGAFLGGLVVLQWATQAYDNDFLGFAQPSANAADGGRAASDGPIGEHNRFAQIMLMLFPLALLRAWDERSRLLRGVALAATGLIVLAVALTFSRGGAIAVAVLVVLLALMRYLRLRHLALVGLAIAILLTFMPDYRERIVSISTVTGLTETDETIENRPDGSIRSRATENLAAALIFADHPVVGVGPGNYNAYYHLYADRVNEYSNELDVRHKFKPREAHNLYLAIGAESGALGLAAFLGIVYVSLRDLFRSWRRLRVASPRLSNLSAAFMLAIVSYLVTGVFLHLSFMRYFWLVIGLAGATAIIARRYGAAAAAEATDRSGPASPGPARPASARSAGAQPRRAG